MTRLLEEISLQRKKRQVLGFQKALVTCRHRMPVSQMPNVYNYANDITMN